MELGECLFRFMRESSINVLTLSPHLPTRMTGGGANRLLMFENIRRMLSGGRFSGVFRESSADYFCNFCGRPSLPPTVFLKLSAENVRKIRFLSNGGTAGVENTQRYCGEHHVEIHGTRLEPFVMRFIVWGS